MERPSREAARRANEGVAKSLSVGRRQSTIAALIELAEEQNNKESQSVETVQGLAKQQDELATQDLHTIPAMDGMLSDESTPQTFVRRRSERRSSSIAVEVSNAAAILPSVESKKKNSRMSTPSEFESGDSQGNLNPISLEYDTVTTGKASASAFLNSPQTPLNRKATRSTTVKSSLANEINCTSTLDEDNSNVPTKVVGDVPATKPVISSSSTSTSTSTQPFSSTTAISSRMNSIDIENNLVSSTSIPSKSKLGQSSVTFAVTTSGGSGQRPKKPKTSGGKKHCSNPTGRNQYTKIREQEAALALLAASMGGLAMAQSDEDGDSIQTPNPPAAAASVSISKDNQNMSFAISQKPPSMLASEVKNGDFSDHHLDTRGAADQIAYSNSAISISQGMAGSQPRLFNNLPISTNFQFSSQSKIRSALSDSSNSPLSEISSNKFSPPPEFRALHDHSNHSLLSKQTQQERPPHKRKPSRGEEYSMDEGRSPKRLKFGGPHSATTTSEAVTPEITTRSSHATNELESDGTEFKETQSENLRKSGRLIKRPTPRGATPFAANPPSKEPNGISSSSLHDLHASSTQVKALGDRQGKGDDADSENNLDQRQLQSSDKSSQNPTSAQNDLGIDFKAAKSSTHTVIDQVPKSGKLVPRKQIKSTVVPTKRSTITSSKQVPNSVTGQRLPQGPIDSGKSQSRYRHQLNLQSKNGVKTSRHDPQPFTRDQRRVAEDLQSAARAITSAKSPIPYSEVAHLQYPTAHSSPVIPNDLDAAEQQLHQAARGRQGHKSRARVPQPAENLECPFKILKHGVNAFGLLRRREAELSRISVLIGDDEDLDVRKSPQNDKAVAANEPQPTGHMLNDEDDVEFFLSADAFDSDTHDPHAADADSTSSLVNVPDFSSLQGHRNDRRESVANAELHSTSAACSVLENLRKYHIGPKAKKPDYANHVPLPGLRHLAVGQLKHALEFEEEGLHNSVDSVEPPFVMKASYKNYLQKCTFCYYSCDWGIADSRVWLPVEALPGYCTDCHFSTQNFTKQWELSRDSKDFDDFHAAEVSGADFEKNMAISRKVLAVWNQKGEHRHPLAETARENGFIAASENITGRKIFGSDAERTANRGHPAIGVTRMRDVSGSKDITTQHAILACRGHPWSQVDCRKAYICESCLEEKVQILRHRRHTKFVDLEQPEISFNDWILPGWVMENPQDPRLKTCMICANQADQTCEDCPLRLCSTCGSLLNTMCKGYLNNMFYTLQRCHIKNDAFLLRSDGGGF